ncbi:molybdenum cofactor guanylyltransferase MobA [Vibrio mangrovi]|uniref:Molybdenum cofactor guanylyltransferase n=1 Tax=Vibrio mangrovi TaxID=474394 RepID=A0A1Y6IQ05_9VIBR|nr:molybdenum cofactor guanylyltransferase MobA [Vibrio mangrovi]MDW6004051.1 molybdenum cofactor guanylyltransferase MobA [Vibrio mangrovi]SMR99151.1 Molybdenum cofactor guanylyltransferase [Vibrio mangrovi]
MLEEHQVTWVILAGGQSSRMGGQDKGLLLYQGRPLIEHVLEALKPQASSIWICANRNQSAYRQYAPVIEDLYPDYPGPLAGLHTALKHAETEWIGILPCDGPLISSDLVQRFCRAVTKDGKIYVAHDGEKRQPVYALAHRSVLSQLESFLEQGDRKVALFFDQVGAHLVDCHDIPSMFMNVNTPEQLLNLEKQQTQ